VHILLRIHKSLFNLIFKHFAPYDITFLFLLLQIFNTLFLYFIFLPELGYMEVFSKFYSPVIYFTKSASAKIAEIVRALKILK